MIYDSLVICMEMYDKKVAKMINKLAKDSESRNK